MLRVVFFLVFFDVVYNKRFGGSSGTNGSGSAGWAEARYRRSRITDRQEKEGTGTCLGFLEAIHSAHGGDMGTLWWLKERISGHVTQQRSKGPFSYQADPEWYSNSNPSRAPRRVTQTAVVCL